VSVVGSCGDGNEPWGGGGELLTIHCSEYLQTTYKQIVRVRQRCDWRLFATSRYTR
jgi:hypothetical protein